MGERGRRGVKPSAANSSIVACRASMTRSIAKSSLHGIDSGLVVPHHRSAIFCDARVHIDALAEFLKHCAGYARDVGTALIQSTWGEAQND